MNILLAVDGSAYTKKIGYAPDFYVANIADGARKL